MTTEETHEASELWAAFERVMAVALEEDLGAAGFEADVTTRSIVPDGLRGRATLYVKQAGVLCGLDALRAAVSQLDDRVAVSASAKDGDEIERGEAVARVDGPVAAILVGERSALNMIGHLSGIATLVRRFVKAAPDVVLTDTRKTLPGLRLLEKYAVRVGGGTNHRYALWDGVLIKDNHIVAAGGVGEAVRRVRKHTTMPVQAECTSLAEVEDALDAGAAAILLDNQGPEQLKMLTDHIRKVKDGIVVEASGGVTIDNVAEIAKTGVDRISIGAFTHSAPGLDVSLKLEEVRN